MPVPLLIVELPETDVGRPEARVLIEACSSGLRQGRCEIRNGFSREPATAVAVVAWRRDERLSAVVEVGHKNASGDSWLSEELTFQPQDAVSERYRALGLALASLFRELEASAAGLEQPGEPAGVAARAEEKPRASSSAVPSTAKGPDRTAQLSRWLVSVGGWAGRDVELGAPRWGVRAAVAGRPGATPFSLLASTAFAWAEPPKLTLSWWTLGLGGAWTHSLGGRFAARARLEGVAERVAASTDDGADDADTKSHWVGGGKLGLDALWYAGRWWGLSSNLELTQLAAKTVVRVRGVPVATVGAFSFALGLSLEIRAGEAF